MKSVATHRSVVSAKAGTQYAAAYREHTAYWIPALPPIKSGAGRDDKPSLKVTP